MLTASMCGTNTAHPKGYQFRRPSGTPCWLLMRFHTPFFYICDGITMRGEANELLLQPPEFSIIHGAPNDFDGGFCNDWVYFEGEEASKIIKDLGIPVNISFSLSDHNTFDRAIADIESEMKNFDIGHAYKISGLLSSLLVDIGRACRTGDYIKSGISLPARTSIEKVHNVLTENYAYPWRLSDMAELSGYSVSRFCGLYKERYGISPNEYLIKRRIDKAKYLLMSGVCNVTETSELCGFSSLHYFSAAFKKYVGCSPTAFVETGEKVKKED